MSVSDDDSNNNGVTIDGVDKVIEAHNIGYRLAEEIRVLREELLVTKQDKRLLIAKNNNLEEALATANEKISRLEAKFEAVEENNRNTVDEMKKKENSYFRLEESIQSYKEINKQLKKEIINEKRKSSLVGKELEKSLEDEVSLRNYCKKLELLCSQLKQGALSKEEKSHKEISTQQKLLKLIENSTRYHLLQSKRLEALIITVSENNSISSSDHAESIAAASLEQHAVNEYYDGLLDLSAHNVSVSLNSEGEIDFATLEHRLKTVDHQMNDRVNAIRQHVIRMKRQAGKTRGHLRNLLQVVRTYEDLLPTTQALSNSQQRNSANSNEYIGSLDSPVRRSSVAAVLENIENNL